MLWPGGRVERFGALAAGRRWLLVEGSGEAEPMPRSPRPLPDAPPGGLRLVPGDALPAADLLDADGRPTRLDPSALAGGKPLLVNLWASYCVPCVAELPLLAARHAAGTERVVAVSLDVPADRQRALELLRSADASFPCFFLPEPVAAAPGALEDWIDLDRLALPTTLVLGPDGRVESILRGPLRRTAIRHISGRGSAVFTAARLVHAAQVHQPRR